MPEGSIESRYRAEKVQGPAVSFVSIVWELLENLSKNCWYVLKTYFLDARPTLNAERWTDRALLLCWPTMLKIQDKRKGKTNGLIVRVRAKKNFLVVEISAEISMATSRKESDDFFVK